MNCTSLLIHIVFATKGRENTLILQNRSDLHAYMAATCRNLKCQPLAINGTADHVHVFIDMWPTVSVSEFVKTIKLSSGDFIKKSHKFWDFKGWQEGYFAGSVGPDGKNRCISYINNQGIHHLGRGFLAEMEWLNMKYQIETDLKNGVQPLLGLEG